MNSENQKTNAVNEQTSSEKEEYPYYKAQPEELPKPTYWPMMFAASTSFFAWGLITLWMLSIVGLIGMAISLGGWINEMRNAGPKER